MKEKYNKMKCFFNEYLAKYFGEDFSSVERLDRVAPNTTYVVMSINGDALVEIDMDKDDVTLFIFNNDEKIELLKDISKLIIDAITEVVEINPEDIEGTYNETSFVISEDYKVDRIIKRVDKLNLGLYLNKFKFNI